MAQAVKNPPVMPEIWVQSLGQEDPLEKEMAMHSSIPAWEILWTEEPGGLQSMGVTKESDTTERLSTHLQIYIEESVLIIGKNLSTRGKMCVSVDKR